MRAGRHRSDHSRLPPLRLPSFRSSSLAPLSGFPPLPNNTLLGLRASRVLPERRPSKQLLCQQGGAIPDCVLRPRDSTARGGVGLLSLTPTTHCQDSERTSTLTSQGILLPASPPIVKGLASVSLLSPARTSRHQGSARHGTLAPLTQLTQLVLSLQQTNGLIQYIRSATQLATAPQVTPY